MARTDWSQVVYDKQLATAKSVHKKLFVTQKILASELPEYIDAGWEKCKDYKLSLIHIYRKVLARQENANDELA